MNIVEIIKNITKFSSNIWQVHPFREGNTRTTAIFIEKYLISLRKIILYLKISQYILEMP